MSTKLWDSWADDALVADKDGGVHALADRVRQAEHRGRSFRDHASRRRVRMTATACRTADQVPRAASRPGASGRARRLTGYCLQYRADLAWACGAALVPAIATAMLPLVRWGSVAATCPRGNGSCSPWPAPSWSTPTYCCSTRPPPRSTWPPSAGASPPPRRCPANAPPWWSRTGSPPPRGPTAWWFWTTARSSKPARTPRCSRAAEPYHRLWDAFRQTGLGARPQAARVARQRWKYRHARQPRQPR